MENKGRTMKEYLVNANTKNLGVLFARLIR